MKRIIYITISLILTSFFINCKSREETVDCFPHSIINLSLNLNLPQYQNLRNVGGFIYTDEQQDGTKGLIIVRTGSHTFKIYDRNAPHLCPDGEATKLEIKDNIKIVCPKDKAEWILITGEPIKISKIPPKTYSYYFFDSSTQILSVKN